MLRRGRSLPQGVQDMKLVCFGTVSRDVHGRTHNGVAAYFGNSNNRPTFCFGVGTLENFIALMSLVAHGVCT